MISGPDEPGFPAVWNLESTPRRSTTRSSPSLSHAKFQDTRIGWSDRHPGQRLRLRQGHPRRIRSELRVFETRAGHGPDLLVWRTDPEDHGALTLFEIDNSGRLDRTLGPLMGICPQGLEIRLGIGASDERLLVRVDDVRHFEH